MVDVKLLDVASNLKERGAANIIANATFCLLYTSDSFSAAGGENIQYNLGGTVL